tara:strand:- start:134 stop:637 length:504 start_codon:yes stop_codon:yes gene_type:complete
MHKKVLTEQAIYYGNVNMPKHWQIDSIDLSHHILHYSLTNKKFIFSKTWDKLNSYITEYVNLNYSINLINKKSWGNIYIPSEKTEPILNVDPVDLKNSPDYTCLYGINTVDCAVKIFYDDNRRKGRSWDIELKDNMFIMFPSTNMYYINNRQKDSLNFVQTITYDYN